MKEFSAFLADDEPLARHKLRELLAEVEWIECLGEAADGEEALQAVDSLKPDLLFLDIEMPALSGLAVLEQARHRPAVIFTTAFDRYAVTAFELQALDYLLKPFGRERFFQAVERARILLRGGQGPSTTDRLRQALSSPGPLHRIFVRTRGRVVPLTVGEIERLEAQDDYVAVHAGGRQYLVHLTLGDIEARLDPDRFLRVHRSHVVNLDHVAGLVVKDGGRIEVEMRDHTRIMASRTRSRELRQRISPSG